MTVLVEDPLISSMAIRQRLPLHESSRRLRELSGPTPRLIRSIPDFWRVGRKKTAPSRSTARCDVSSAAVWTNSVRRCSSRRADRAA